METESIISNINRFTINLRLVVVTVTIDTRHKALFLFLKKKKKRPHILSPHLPNVPVVG